MSLLQCTNCDSKFKVDSGWAKTAITMMIPAPVSKSILLVAALAVASVVI